VEASRFILPNDEDPIIPGANVPTWLPVILALATILVLAAVTTCS
jgi:hypothetical protein